MQRLLISLYVVLLGVSVGFGQRLYYDTGLLRFDPALQYENYAREGIKPYTAGPFSSYNRPQFDELGNYIIDGRQLFHLEERRGQARSAGSRLEKMTYAYQSFTGRLVIGYDSYQDWASRLIVGDRIRTKFTSLTLDMVAMNGIRWDWDMNKTLATFITSRVDWPNYSDRDNDLRDRGLNKDQRWATYLIGGHIERRFGALRIGGNYVNQHRVNSLISWGDNNLKGVHPTGLAADNSRVMQGGSPFLVVVKFSDGTDLDGSGARVFDVRIEGDLQHIKPVITRHNTDDPPPLGNPNRDGAFLPGKSVPPFVQFLKGEFPQMQPEDQGFFEANGTEYLLYWFEIPHEQRRQIETLQFKALVANDYQISVADVFRPAPTSQNSTGLTEERVTFFREVAAASGNVQDLSNLKWVDFEYGRPTGRSIASLRVDFISKDFQLRSEFARSFHFLQYPGAGGLKEWQTEKSNAYFVNLKKKFRDFSLGAEYFNMDPGYSTILSIREQSYGTYGDHRNAPFSINPSFGGRYNYYLDLSTVDDNDDKDRRPDFHFLQGNDHPTPFSGEFGDDNGIFPGQDLDQDGRSDINQNGNEIADYQEAFFLYDVDPPEFDYGEDLNNNNFMDHREDDRDPDYPYDIDQKGYHFFADAHPHPKAKITLGHYDTRQIWGGGKSRSNYGELHYRQSLYPYAVLDFANKLKQVKDDIRDDYARFNTTQTYTGVIDIEDELWMRDSVVNVAYIDATFLKIKNLNLNNRLKYTANFQRSTGFQEEDLIEEWAWVLRGNYNWKWGSLRVKPQFKYMAFVRDDREKRLPPISERFFYPMLLVGFDLTPNTALQLGAQGFPFLQSTFRDKINDRGDFDSEDYLIQLTNNSDYNGHQLSFNLGYQKEIKMPRDKTRTYDDINRSLLFIRLIMGLEPFKG